MNQPYGIHLVAALVLVVCGPPLAADPTPPKIEKRTESSWCDPNAVHRVVMEFSDRWAPIPDSSDRVENFRKALVIELNKRGLRTDSSSGADVTIMISLEAVSVLTWRELLFPSWDVDKKEIKFALAAADGDHSAFPSTFDLHRFDENDPPLLPVARGEWGTRDHRSWDLDFQPRKKAATLAKRLKKRRDAFCR